MNTDTTAHSALLEAMQNAKLAEKPYIVRIKTTVRILLIIGLTVGATALMFTALGGITSDISKFSRR